jgi:hypothetical protein
MGPLLQGVVIDRLTASKSRRSVVAKAARLEMNFNLPSLPG